MTKRRITLSETAFIILLVLFIRFSVTSLNDYLSNPESHSETISILEEQKQDALMLSVAVTSASTLLSALPDDMASPIADKLADLSLPLFLIVAVIYLEIFLLTTFGWISSLILLPTASVLLIGFVLWRKETFLVWTKKVLILALALVFLIPASAAITSKIEETFSENVNQKLHAAAYIADATEAVEKEDANAIVSFFSGVADKVTSMVDNVTSLVDSARNTLNTLIDAVAVLFITSCAIPVLTLLLFLKAIKGVMNVEIPTKMLTFLIPPAKTERRSLEKLQE